MDPIAWGLGVAAFGFIIAKNCGVGMIETMASQCALLTVDGLDPAQFDELCASLGAEWDACTVIYSYLAD